MASCQCQVPCGRGEKSAAGRVWKPPPGKEAFFECDATVVVDGAFMNTGTPTIGAGSRGLVYAEVIYQPDLPGTCIPETMAELSIIRSRQQPRWLPGCMMIAAG